MLLSVFLQRGHILGRGRVAGGKLVGAADLSTQGFGLLLNMRGKAVGHVQGKLVVKQAQGLQGSKGFIALGGALAGVCTVQCGHKRIGLGSGNKTVD